MKRVMRMTIQWTRQLYPQTVKKYFRLFYFSLPTKVLYHKSDLLKVSNQFSSSELTRNIVQHRNLYTNLKINGRWLLKYPTSNNQKNVISDEMKAFFGTILNMGFICPGYIEKYQNQELCEEMT